MKRQLAKDKFKKGDRVVMSAECHVHNKDNSGFSKRIKKYGEFGVVVGFSREGGYVRIVRDGQKTAQTWHASFWESVRPPAYPVRPAISVWFEDECEKVANEVQLSQLQQKIATGSISAAAETADRTSIKSSPASESFTVSQEPSDERSIRETSIETGGWLSGVWQKLRSFVTGFGLKLPNVHK